VFNSDGVGFASFQIVTNVSPLRGLFPSPRSPAKQTAGKGDVPLQVQSQRKQRISYYIFIIEESCPPAISRAGCHENNIPFFSIFSLSFTQASEIDRSEHGQEEAVLIPTSV